MRTDFFMDGFDDFEEAGLGGEKALGGGEAEARASAGGVGETAYEADPGPGAAPAGGKTPGLPPERRRELRNMALFCAVLALGLALFYWAGQSGQLLIDKDGNAIAPAQVADAKATAVSYALNGATNFNGKWGEWHKEMVASGQGEGYEGYERNLGFLKEMVRQSRATNAFVIYRGQDGVNRISANVDAKQATAGRRLTGAAIESAWAGQAAAEANPWDYAHDKPVWTAYAPIYDREGAITAVLAMDYPVPIIRSYPEWNRSSKRWNGYGV